MNNKFTAVQRQTAVTAYLCSKQLLLCVFAWYKILTYSHQVDTQTLSSLLCRYMRANGGGFVDENSAVVE